MRVALTSITYFLNPGNVSAPRGTGVVHGGHAPGQARGVRFHAVVRYPPPDVDVQIDQTGRYQVAGGVDHGLCRPPRRSLRPGRQRARPPRPRPRTACRSCAGSITVPPLMSMSYGGGHAGSSTMGMGRGPGSDGWGRKITKKRNHGKWKGATRRAPLGRCDTVSESMPCAGCCPPTRRRAAGCPRR